MMADHKAVSRCANRIARALAEATAAGLAPRDVLREALQGLPSEQQDAWLAAQVSVHNGEALERLGYALGRADVGLHSGLGPTAAGCVLAGFARALHETADRRQKREAR